MSNVRIDKENRCYIIPEGEGHSCLGFDVAHDRSVKLIGWIEEQEVCPCLWLSDLDYGTMLAYYHYQDLMKQAKLICDHEHIRCPVELTPQLIGLEGRIVLVVDKWDEEHIFKVGKSTGWMPIHLELSGLDMSGGPAVVGAPFKELKVIQ